MEKELAGGQWMPLDATIILILKKRGAERESETHLITRSHLKNATVPVLKLGGTKTVLLKQNTFIGKSKT